jgi:hypothetical protein
VTSVVKGFQEGIFFVVPGAIFRWVTWRLMDFIVHSSGNLE